MAGIVEMGETPRSASPTREGLGWFNPCQEGGRLQLVKGWGVQPLSKKGAGSKPRRVGEVQPWSGRGPSPSREELSFQISNHCCQLPQVVVRTLSKRGPSSCREGLGGSNPCQEGGRLQVVKGWGASNPCQEGGRPGGSKLQLVKAGVQLVSKGCAGKHP